MLERASFDLVILDDPGSDTPNNVIGIYLHDNQLPQWVKVALAEREFLGEENGARLDSLDPEDSGRYEPVQSLDDIGVGISVIEAFPAASWGQTYLFQGVA